MDYEVEVTCSADGAEDGTRTRYSRPHAAGALADSTRCVARRRRVATRESLRDISQFVPCRTGMNARSHRDAGARYRPHADALVWRPREDPFPRREEDHVR